MHGLSSYFAKLPASEAFTLPDIYPRDDVAAWCLYKKGGGKEFVDGLCMVCVWSVHIHGECVWLTESNKSRHAGLQSSERVVLVVCPGLMHRDAVKPVRLVVKVATQHLS
jgi:hypothetical protein